MELQIDELKTLELPEAWKSIDQLEEDISSQPTAIYDFPVNNVFTDHLYSRRFFMPKNSLLTSEIHLTQHQYIVALGTVAVWSPVTQTWTRLQAPYAGITEPMTRRVLFAFEDTAWITYHVLTEEENEHRDVDRILERLLDKPHRAQHHRKAKEHLICTGANWSHIRKEVS